MNRPKGECMGSETRQGMPAIVALGCLLLLGGAAATVRADDWHRGEKSISKTARHVIGSGAKVISRHLQR